MDRDSPKDAVRLDRWLWAARFFKTRALAAQAIAGGRVQVDGERVKRAKLIRVGDHIRLRQGPYEYHLVVRELAERRASARVAATWYEESAESREARAILALRLKSSQPPRVTGKGRPTKRERRILERFKRRHDD